ncbi:MAG: AMIN domain-containing protein [Thermodesulfobacteriota bacterium]
MRLPERTFTALWIGCLLMAMICGSSWADSSGTITGVKVDPDKRTITISTKGQPAKHLARVIGRPNRLVIDFDGAKVGDVPHSIRADAGDIHEIRVGHFNSQARVVLDFQNHPVPPFELRRKNGKVQVVLGGGSPGSPKTAKAKTPNESSDTKNGSESQLSPSFVPAVAAPKTPEMGAAPPVRHPAATAARGPHVGSGVPQGQPHPAAAKPQFVAQAGEVNVPSSSFPARRGTGPGGSGAGAQERGNPVPGQDQGNGPRMVREVRPPVTPPTPDPRLLVQEITELKFVQVGHNARLIIRGGDNLDYRLNKLSPTKVKIDLINAEISKAHQKPLKTDAFSTSVEMIVPGSQTIFVQLKDAVSYQVEKKKGVLMVDFPPPRLALTPGQKAKGKAAEGGDTAGREEYARVQDSRMAQREAARIMREEQIRQANETREVRIRSLHKEREQLVKKRGEIEKQYEITPDPEVFNKMVTIDFQGISLKNAFRLLAEQAGINIIVSGELKGTTTLKLSQVPLGQVIDTILTTHDLDREIIGNVMRVGPRKAIQDNKEARQKQKIRLILDIDKRIQENEKQSKDLEGQREQALKELAKEEAAEEPPTEDVTSVETVGQTETITIEGEPVELLLVRVKLSYAKSSKIVNILNCVFNQRCDAAAVQAAEADKKLAEKSLELSTGGFVPGSPGYESRMRSAERMAREERQTAAQERLAMSAEQARAQARGGESGMDPKLAKLLAHTVLWPNDDYNMIFIKDTPQRIDEMKKLIATLDVPSTQVLIESRVVRARKDWARGLGIQWGGRNNQQGAVSAGNISPGAGGSPASPLPYGAPFGRNTAIWGVTGVGGADGLAPTSNVIMRTTDIANQFVVNLPATVANLTNIMGFAMQFGHLATDHLTDLDVRLSLGEHAGKAKTVGRPKVQVLDNETATIKTGSRIAFSTISADGTQIQFIDVPLELSVKPKVFPDGRIQMVIKVTDNDVGPLVNGLASIETREASTHMIVKDGDTAVIGGIMRKITNHSKEGWPGLMNVPILGTLFGTKTEDDSLTELLVFITPAIIKRPPPAS